MSNVLSPTMELNLRAAGRGALAGGRILVIDDELGVGKTLKALLEATGHRVVSEPGGLEGLGGAEREVRCRPGRPGDAGD
jgi:hypothetical protein